jgi:hypothetical protein
MAFDSSGVTRQSIAMALVRVSTMGDLTCWPRDASNEIVLVMQTWPAIQSIEPITKFETLHLKGWGTNAQGEIFVD